MVRCPSCGEENPAGKRFCGECGTPLAAAAPRREVRKTVTVLFCDVAGSTALGEQLDPESLRALMTRYFAEMKRVIEGHGGTVEKFIGDAVMAVFGIPVLHEDDALRAVRAAADIRDALQGLNATLETERSVTISARTGVNTGEVVAGDPATGQTLVTGDAVNTAARLEQAAGADEILLGELTWRLVRDAVQVEPVAPISAKGKAEPVPAYRLLTVGSASEGHSRRLDAPMVGRDRELDRLRDAFEDVVRERRCHLFTVLGAAGVGKSRLVAEFKTGVGREATVLHGRCLPYGEGITYWPLREIVLQAAGIEESMDREEALGKLRTLVEAERDGHTIATRTAQAIGLELQPAPQEELFWAVRKFLEALARRRPLVVEWDDIHWAEPTLLELIEHIADWSREAPILLLCPARPELLDTRPGWGGGKLNASTVLLESLAAEVVEQLLDFLPGGDALPEGVRAAIALAAEGNPLFVEEMLGMLRDEGLLREEDGAWVARADAGQLRVPPTIQALLAARLDRLAPRERGMAERASVVGRVFERSAVAELTPSDERSEVPGSLLALVRKELVRPDHSGRAGDDAFRFRHLLIRDAAYEALPKAERADLHERFASWLEAGSGDREMEYEDIVGYHLEQAYRYRQRLGQGGDSPDELAGRAALHLAAAGRRALDRGDLPAGISFLERSGELLPEGHPARLRLLPDLVESLAIIGSFERAEALVTRGRRSASGADEHLIALVEMAGLHLEELTDPERWRRRAPAITEDARQACDAAGDHAGMARALRVEADAHCYDGRLAKGFAAATLGERMAREAGELREMREALGLRLGLIWMSPVPVDEGIEMLRAALHLHPGERRIEADAWYSLALLRAMQGEVDEARLDAQRSISVSKDFGLVVETAAGEAQGMGAIEIAAGDFAEAERRLRRGYEELSALGERKFLTSIIPMLAYAVARQGRSDEAMELVERGRGLAAAGDVDAQVWLRLAAAAAHAGRSQLGPAEASAREAVALVELTDMLPMKGHASLELGQILLKAGRIDEAEAALHNAGQYFEQKGHLVGLAAVKQVRATLDEARL